MRKYFPFAVSFFILISTSFLWEYIKLPYNEENNIIGEYYYKKINPLNDTIRFLSFSILPCLAYLIVYLKVNKETYSFKPLNNDYFLKKKESYNKDPLGNYYIFFIVLILIEFLSLDFNRFILGKVDIYHESTFLVPPLNYLNKGGLFQSTFYDYGFIANNLGLIFNFIFGYYTIGSVILIKLIFTFFNKFFLILISKKVISYLNIKNFFKKILFIIFTFLAISLPNYYDFYSYFNPRHALYLSFILLLIVATCNNIYLNLKFFTIGCYSSLSIFWWFDIGAYINILIILTGIYLLIHKKKKNLFFLILGIFFSWTLIYLIMPIEEIKELIFVLKFIYSSTNEYILGLEYIRPFSSNSGRWTKALVLIYITGLMIINLNFSKKFYTNYKTKISINLIFISGVLVFKSALMRSDSYHLKYSSGLYTIVFFLIISYFFFQRLELNQKIKKIIRKFKSKNLSIIAFLFFLICSFSLLSGITNKNDNDLIANKIKNFWNAKRNINNFIKAKDELYISKDTKLVLDYYKDLSKNDNCIQVIADEVSFPYFLKKPSCTQFYIPVQIVNNVTENKFIEQLSKNSPMFILYSSPNNIQSNHLNMPKAINYINKKYSFFENFNNYIFYKKNKN